MIRHRRSVSGDKRSDLIRETIFGSSTGVQARFRGISYGLFLVVIGTILFFIRSKS